MAPSFVSTRPRQGSSPTRKHLSPSAARARLVNNATGITGRRAVSFSSLLAKQRRRQRQGLFSTDLQSDDDDSGEWTSEEEVEEGSGKDGRGGGGDDGESDEAIEDIISLSKSNQLMRGKVRFVSNPLPSSSYQSRSRERTTSSSSSSTASSSARAVITKLYSPVRLATRSVFISYVLSPDSAPFIPRRVSAPRPHIDTPTPSPSKPLPQPRSVSASFATPLSSSRLYAGADPSPALTDISTFSPAQSTLTTPQLAQEGFAETSTDSISFVYEPATISEMFLRHTPSHSSTSSPESILNRSLSPHAKPFPPTSSIGRRLEYEPAEISYAPVLEAKDESVFALDGEEEARKASEVYHAEVRRVSGGDSGGNQLGEEESSPVPKKRKSTRGDGDLRGKRIPIMVGPESLPYARNPSGVDGSVVDSDGRLNIWRPSSNDPEPEHVDHLHFQRRPGGGGPTSSSRAAADGPASNDGAYAHPSVYTVGLVHRSDARVQQQPFRSFSSTYPVGCLSALPSASSLELPTTVRSGSGQLENDSIFLPAGPAPGFLHPRQPGPKAPIGAEKAGRYRKTVAVEVKSAAIVEAKGKTVEVGSWRREKEERIERQRSEEESIRAAQAALKEKEKLEKALEEKEVLLKAYETLLKATAEEARARENPSQAKDRLSKVEAQKDQQRAKTTDASPNGEGHLTWGSLTDMFKESTNQPAPRGEKKPAGLAASVHASKPSGSNSSKARPAGAGSSAKRTVAVIATSTSSLSKPTKSGLPPRPMQAASSSTGGPGSKSTTTTPSSSLSTSQHRSSRPNGKRGGQPSLSNNTKSGNNNA